MFLAVAVFGSSAIWTPLSGPLKGGIAMRKFIIAILGALLLLIPAGYYGYFRLLR
jgi:hypothetical protein